MRLKRPTSIWIVGCAVTLAAGALALGEPATGPSTAPAATQAVATQPADADVVALIRRLGADDEADRANAQQQLVDLGSTATDELRRAADHDADLEVRNRANAALAQIRDRDANGPTLVSLHVHQANLTSVLAELSRQAHAEVAQAYVTVAGRAGGPMVTLDADRQPFWEVLADVCGQANVCPLPQLETANRNRLLLYPTSRNWLAKGPHQAAGAFCVGVAEVARMTSVDLAGPPLTNDWFTVRLIVFPEPKLVVTQVSPLALREATDDAGNSLVPPAPAGLMRAMVRMGGRMPLRTVDTRLKYPSDHPGHRIATLAGDLAVTLAQGAQRFEADDVLGHPHVTRPLPGVKARVSMARQGLGFAVTVELARDGMADAQWYAMTNRVNDLSLEDAAGRPLTPPYAWIYDASNSDATFKATGTFSRQVAMGANLLMNRMGVAANPNAAPAAPPGEPVRIVWNVAARFKVVTVPVAFHDLPMP